MQYNQEWGKLILVYQNIENYLIFTWQWESCLHISCYCYLLVFLLSNTCIINCTQYSTYCIKLVLLRFNWILYWIVWTKQQWKWANEWYDLLNNCNKSSAKYIQMFSCIWFQKWHQCQQEQTSWNQAIAGKHAVPRLCVGQLPWSGRVPPGLDACSLASSAMIWRMVSHKICQLPFFIQWIIGNSSGFW